MSHTLFRSRLYFVAGTALTSAHTLLQQVDAALAGGAGMVQYVPGDQTTRETVALAVELVMRCRKSRVPLIVCGRVDLALAATADGVHLGGDDMPVAFARRMLGPHATIGVTIRSRADAREAERQGASYLGIGPIFPTLDLPGLALGTRVIGELAEATPLPLCAMGGITLDNAMQLAPTPAALIAVSCPLTSAREAQRAAHSLAQRLQLA